MKDVGNRGAAGVALEGEGEHDEDNDGGAAEGGGPRRSVWKVLDLGCARRAGGHTHGDNVARDIISEGEVSRNSHQQINEASAPDRALDYTRRALVRTVLNLVQDRKHLRHRSAHAQHLKLVSRYTGRRPFWRLTF